MSRSLRAVSPASNARNMPNPRTASEVAAHLSEPDCRVCFSLPSPLASKRYAASLALPAGKLKHTPPLADALTQIAGFLSRSRWCRAAAVVDLSQLRRHPRLAYAQIENPHQRERRNRKERARNPGNLRAREYAEQHQQRM